MRLHSNEMNFFFTTTYSTFMMILHENLVRRSAGFYGSNPYNQKEGIQNKNKRIKKKKFFFASIISFPYPSCQDD